MSVTCGIVTDAKQLLKHALQLLNFLLYLFLNVQLSKFGI